jgi:hypothetical protein
MKKLLLILATLVTVNAFSQQNFLFTDYRDIDEYYYGEVSFDVNDKFRILNNTEEVPGLDYDIEVGVRDQKFAFFVFYGEYPANNYENFGAGLEYFLYDKGMFSVSSGVQLGGSYIQEKNSNKGDLDYLYGLRLKGMLNLNSSVSVFTRFQLQQRMDFAGYNIYLLPELNVGLLLKFYKSRW